MKTLKVTLERKFSSTLVTLSLLRTTSLNSLGCKVLVAFTCKGFFSLLFPVLFISYTGVKTYHLKGLNLILCALSLTGPKDFRQKIWIKSILFIIKRITNRLQIRKFYYENSLVLFSSQISWRSSSFPSKDTSWCHQHRTCEDRDGRDHSGLLVDM